MKTSEESTIVPFPGDENHTVTVGQYLLDRLYQLGVEHIFGIPGDYIIRFDKLIEEHPIKFINTTRENTAGYMADAYARLKGIGAACITYGVGINIINATAQAFTEGVPLVIISGAASTEEFLNNPFLHHMINKSCNMNRDLTQLEIFKQVTVGQAVLDDPLKVSEEIDRLLNLCLTENQPVYIELPRDMVDKPLPFHQPHPVQEIPCDKEALTEALNETLMMLEGSSRPIIWVGREVSSFGLADDVIAFAERFNIPIVSTLLGKSVIDERHPLFVGVYQGGMSRKEVEDFVDNSDCIMMLGVLRSDVDTGFHSTHIETNHRIVSSIRRVAIAHHEFPDIHFSHFIQALPHLPMSKIFSNDYPKNIDRMQSFTAEKDKNITTARLLECLQSYIKPDHILTTDCGDCLFASADLILGRNSYCAPAYFATMGYGVPASVGGAISQPERRVIGLVGDGGFQMTATELTTALRYAADPIIIVMNNHGYGTERPLIEGEFNEIENWNYAQLPEFLGGGKGVRVKTENALEKSLKEALSQRGTYWVIEVELGKTDFSPALIRFKEHASRTVK